MAYTYEELIKKSNGRVQELDEAVRMLSAKDGGIVFFSKINKLYVMLEETGDLQYLEEISNELYKITGYRI